LYACQIKLKNEELIIIIYSTAIKGFWLSCSRRRTLFWFYESQNAWWWSNM